MNETILALVAAHFIADFLLQPNWLQQRKHRIWATLLHSVFVAVLSYLFIQQWTVWVLPLLIFLLHALVDIVKQRFADSWQLFCADQFLHVALTAGVAFFCVEGGFLPVFSGIGLPLMVLVCGFSVAVQGAGFLVGKVAGQLQQENGLLLKIKGLKNGGRLIGLLERSLIFLFILIGQSAGIGFLVAAKSILRFGEARDDQQLAEYVLIGTLLSFGLAIAAASLTKALLKGVA